MLQYIAGLTKICPMGTILRLYFLFSLSVLLLVACAQPTPTPIPVLTPTPTLAPTPTPVISETVITFPDENLEAAIR